MMLPFVSSEMFKNIIKVIFVIKILKRVIIVI